MSIINNFLCCLITAAIFAMVATEAGNQPTATHSGTQQQVRR